VKIFKIVDYFSFEMQLPNPRQYVTSDLYEMTNISTSLVEGKLSINWCCLSKFTTVDLMHCLMIAADVKQDGENHVRFHVTYHLSENKGGLSPRDFK